MNESRASHLTVCIMTYNRAVFLREMLESVKSQTCQEFVLKIYDNGSTDETSSIVSLFQRDYPCIYVKNELNIGSTPNFNKALAECTTDFIMLAHDDDIMLPALIESELYVMNSHSDVNLVCSDINYIDIQGKLLRKGLISESQSFKNDIVIESNQYIDYLIDRGNIITCPTIMLRCKNVKQNDIEFRYDVGSANDVFFWLELNSIQGSLYFINQPLYNYRIHPAQDSKNVIRQIPMLKKPIFLFLKKHKYHKTIQQRWLKHVNEEILAIVKKNKITPNEFASLKSNIYIPFLVDIHFRISIFYITKLKDTIRFFLRKFRKMFILHKRTNPKPKIAILYICTGRYAVFWKKFYKATEKYFLHNSEKHYFVFTDSDEILGITDDRIHPVYQTTEEWPFPTLNRFSYFLRIRDKLIDFDFIMFMNANLLVKKRIDEKEILPDPEHEGNLFVTLHPGYYSKSTADFNYDRNKLSTAFVAPEEGCNYYAGGFNGGTFEEFYSMVEILDERIKKDFEKGVIALWHDESHLNRYMIDYKKPFKKLSPAFLYPQGVRIPFQKKIIILDKSRLGGHSFLRSQTTSKETPCT